MGSKIVKQVFNDSGLEPVVEGDSPYGQSVLDDIHKKQNREEKDSLR